MFNSPNIGTMHTYKSAFCIGLLMLTILPFSSRGQQDSSFQLIADPANPTADSISNRITEIQTGINQNDSWKDFTLTGDHPAAGLLNKLVEEKGISSLRTASQVYLTKPDAHFYEIRDLYVKTVQTGILKHKELVLRFNEKGQLIDTDLGADIHNYQLILDRKIEANQAKRQEVEQHVAKFQHALAQNDAQLVASELANDAVIIKGNIVRYFYNGQYGPYYHYRKISQDQYLQDINKRTVKPTISYNQLKVYAHTFIDDVYVAIFEQSWTNRSYRDKGYVAMVIDLNKEKPVQLRRWQENPFQTGRLEYKPNTTPQVATVSLPAAIVPKTAIKVTTLPTEKQNPSQQPTFLTSTKNRVFILAGTTAAISIGIAILNGGKDGNLPNPPGRPALH